MNKYAAEKIASEYYNLGADIALGEMTKTANPLMRLMARKGMPINPGVLNNLKAMKRVPGNVARNAAEASKAFNTAPEVLARRNALRSFNMPGVTAADINNIYKMPTG